MKTNSCSTGNSQTNTPPDFDRLIISLGEAIHYLVDEYNRCDEAGVKRKGNSERLHAKNMAGDIFQRINDLQIAVTTLPATSLDAAAVQMRALAYMNPRIEEEDEDTTHTSRTLYSVLNAIEANGGGSRDQWGGQYFISSRLNPFNHSVELDSGTTDGQEVRHEN